MQPHAVRRCANLPAPIRLRREDRIMNSPDRPEREPQKAGVYDREPQKTGPRVGRATLIALILLAILVIVWLLFFS
jgi:cell division septal protein FtsQ